MCVPSLSTVATHSEESPPFRNIAYIENVMSGFFMAELILKVTAFGLRRFLVDNYNKVRTLVLEGALNPTINLLLG